MTSMTSVSGSNRNDNLGYVRGRAGTQGVASRSSLPVRTGNERINRNPEIIGGREILSLEQLLKLSEHQGRHVGQSMIEPFLQPIWKMLVEVLPTWWSPSAIILTGLIFHATTTVVLLSYCPDANGEAPRWVYYLCALGLLTFQTLDAVDDRQAKKIRCHSAFRELLNHGCNAFSNAFVVLGACTATKLGTHPRIMFIEFFSMLFIFYSVHWQTYCSGIINFQYFDSMEAQFSVIFLYLLTGIFGSGFWDTEVFSGCPLKLVPVLISLVIGYFCCLGRLSFILIQGGVGKNGSTVADTSVLSPLFPMCILMIAGYMISSNSQSNILERHPTLFLAFLGVPLIKLSCKIVISHMSRSEMTLFDNTLYGLGLSVIIQGMNLLSDDVLLLICFVYSLLSLLWYCLQVYKEMSSYLKVQTSPNNLQALGIHTRSSPH